MYTKKALIAWLCLSVLRREAFALPHQGLSVLESPNKAAAVRLSDTDERWVYRLTISRFGRELAHYKFQGELISGYWSSSGKYVAINNHYGHRGWYVWIISLEDGSIIKANGRTKSSDYDRYIDIDDYGPDISQTAKTEIETVYPGYAGDRMREGYSSIAYGWSGADLLQLFHEFTLVRLYESEQAYVDVYTLLRVKSRGSDGSEVILVKKVKGPWKIQNLPVEVLKTLSMGPG